MAADATGDATTSCGATSGDGSGAEGGSGEAAIGEKRKRGKKTRGGMRSKMARDQWNAVRRAADK